jgi:hypothetical protein
MPRAPHGVSISRDGERTIVIEDSGTNAPCSPPPRFGYGCISFLLDDCHSELDVCPCPHSHEKKDLEETCGLLVNFLMKSKHYRESNPVNASSSASRPNKMKSSTSRSSIIQDSPEEVLPPPDVMSSSIPPPLPTFFSTPIEHSVPASPTTLIAPHHFLFSQAEDEHEDQEDEEDEQEDDEDENQEDDEDDEDEEFEEDEAEEEEVWNQKKRKHQSSSSPALKKQRGLSYYDQLKVSHNSTHSMNFEEMKVENANRKYDESYILSKKTWNSFVTLIPKSDQPLVVIGALHKAEVEYLSDSLLLQIFEYRYVDHLTSSSVPMLFKLGMIILNNYHVRSLNTL